MHIISFANNSPERWWRLDMPKKWIERYTSHSFSIYDFSHWISGIQKADLIIGRSFISPDAVDLVHKFGKRIVYELDGAAPLYKEHAPNFRSLRQSSVTNKKQIETMKKCDAVFVSTEPLMRWVQTFYTGQIYPFPNFMDFEWWNAHPVAPEDKRPGEVRIGWFGMPSHAPDIIRMLIPLIQSRHTDANTKFYIPDTMRQAIPTAYLSRVRFIPAWTMDQRPVLARSLRIDISLVFLSDNPFNACKSAIKYFENAADAIPGIYSPTVYRDFVVHRETGLLAETQGDWLHAIDLLIRDKRLYTHIAHASLRDVHARFNVKKKYKEWVDVIEEAAQ